MFHRGLARTLVLLLATLSLAGCTNRSIDGRRSTSGPFDMPGAFGYILDMKRFPRFVDSFSVLHLRKTEVGVKILSVDPLGGRPALRGDGPMFFYPPATRHGLNQVLSRDELQCRSRELIAAEGALLEKADDPKNRGWELLIPYRSRGEVIAARVGLNISYLSSGTHGCQFMPSRLVACPISMTNTACSEWADEQFPDG